MVGPLGEDVGWGVLEGQVFGKGARGTGGGGGGGVEAAKERISKEGGVVVGGGGYK